MARVALVAIGIVLGVVGGAAVGIHADDEGDNVSVPANETPALTDIEPVPTPEPAYGVWDKLAACESTSRWHVATGNGYYGGLQQDLVFWRRHGGMQFAPGPDLASRAEQILIAQRGLAVQGWSAWPACSRRLGLR